MKPVSNEWRKLEYCDPEKALLVLREAELSIPPNVPKSRSMALRTRSTRRYLEGRQAALFCHGMSKVLGTKVVFAQLEDQDFDIVTRYDLNGERHFGAVQLKELVPESGWTASANTTLQQEIDKLAPKYVAGCDLTVALHVNREMALDIDKLTLPNGKLGALWFFGASEPSQSTWFLLGDVLRDDACLTKFAYPKTYQEIAASWGWCVVC